MLKNDNYRQFIEDNFKIVNKQGVLVDFILNAIQRKYLLEDYTGTDDILKARQEGFSSLINAIFTADFLLKEHSYSVIVADIEENATGLLDRVKMFLSSYEEKNKIKIPLKYDSRFEMYNNFMDSRFVIGTAKNAEFGRSKTITNLHCSELAFFSNIFYSASQFYPVDFLAKKKKELGRLFRQEYPESEAEAFITSGDPYFKA